MHMYFRVPRAILVHQQYDVPCSMSLYSVSFQSLSPVLVGWIFTTAVMMRARGREVETETY